MDRKLIATVLALLSGLASAWAQVPVVEGADILWAGTYRAQVVGTVEQPTTASGKTNQLSDIVKLETTTTVRARLGTSFGFEYRLSGDEPGMPVAVNVVVILPKAGLLNPATQKRYYREQWRPSQNVVGATTMVGYLFERDWEVVPGVWKFEIWHGQQKLAEQVFCVVRDQALGPGEPAEAQGDPCHSAATA